MAKKTTELAAEVRKMKDAELGIELTKLRERLYELRTQAVTEKIADPSQFTRVRRQIARIQTEQNARQQKATA
ncbi:MAG: 50S ribosomal protein L29 [Phycisphaerales bacterium]